MNKVILLGRLTKDPELRYANNNLAICSFTLAVNRQKKDEVDFIPVVTFDKQAEFCSKYFHKGQQIAVVGRLQIRSWEDNEGKKRYTTEIVASECYFADSKKEGQQEQRGDAYEPPEYSDELPF